MGQTERVAEPSRIDSSRSSPAQKLGADDELERLNRVTQRIIGAAIEVHRCLGPGLAERIYADALSIEFHQAGIPFEREVHLPVVYKGHRLGHYEVDFLVEGSVVVEVKSVDRPLPVFEAQVMNYMRLTESRLGLLINFNSRLASEGIKRFAL